MQLAATADIPPITLGVVPSINIVSRALKSEKVINY